MNRRAFSTIKQFRYTKYFFEDKSLCSNNMNIVKILLYCENSNYIVIIITRVIIYIYRIVLWTACLKLKTDKTSFVSPKARASKTGINLMIFILIFVENCLWFDAIYAFSVWLRTGPNPADSYRFRSHTIK